MLTMRTWNSIWWKFASCKHDISEVERAVVNATLLHFRAGGHKMREWGGDPSQSRQVTSSQHVDVGPLCQLLILIWK